MFVLAYAIQPVAKPVVNRLSNRFDNRLYRVYKHSTGCQTRLTTTGLTNGCIVYTAGCQTGCTTGLTTVLNEQCVCSTRLNDQCLFVQDGCQTRLTTGFTTGWMFVYTIQPVVKPVVQPDWQPVVSCKRSITKQQRQKHGLYRKRRRYWHTLYNRPVFHASTVTCRSCTNWLVIQWHLTTVASIV